MNEHTEARFPKPFHARIVLGWGFLLIWIGGIRLAGGGLNESQAENDGKTDSAEKTMGLSFQSIRCMESHG
jgi:hypothetical protein